MQSAKRDAPTRPGRRPGHSREEIARTALSLVDRDGLERFSMRALAEEIGIGTMTLYTYFRDKDDLLAAVVDAAAAEHPVFADHGPWQDRIRIVMRELRDALTRHPALLELRLRSPIITPGAMRSTEAGLKALRDAGLQPADAARAFRTLFLYTFGFAAFSAPDLTDEDRRHAKAAMMLLPRDEYPTLAANTNEMIDTLGGDDQYEHGLELILAAIEP